MLKYESKQLDRLEEEIKGFEQLALAAFLSEGKSLNHLLYQVNLYRENLQYVHRQFIMPQLKDNNPHCENCFEELQADEIGQFTSQVCQICYTIGE